MGKFLIALNAVKSLATVRKRSLFALECSKMRGRLGAPTPAPLGELTALPKPLLLLKGRGADSILCHVPGRTWPQLRLWFADMYRQIYAFTHTYKCMLMLLRHRFKLWCKMLWQYDCFGQAIFLRKWKYPGLSFIGGNENTLCYLLSGKWSTLVYLPSDEMKLLVLLFLRRKCVYYRRLFCVNMNRELFFYCRSIARDP